MRSFKRKKGVKLVKAKPITVDGIPFKSTGEGYFYKKSKEAGFNFKYEDITFELIPPFEFQQKKIRPLGFTPDFVDHDNQIVVEIKGWETPDFKLRNKMFKYFLYKNHSNYKYFIISSAKKEVDKNIEWLKQFLIKK